ncbi:MAG: NAD-dependent epimerase/dehydratase family protein, partial [Lachnospiraceae bacterium]
MERIAITGATSMIGAALVREALSKGTEVFALVRKDTPKLSRLPLEAEGLHLVSFDLTDQASIEALSTNIPPCDVFYHLAWGHTGSARNASVRLQADNVQTCLDVLEAAANAGCAAFVGAGSQAEYGPKDLPVISPDTKTDPATPYGAAKLAACHLSRMLAKEKGIRWVWPRIFSTYGIYDKPTSMVASSLEKMLRGEPTHFSPAKHRWDYLFSEDAGRAYYAMGE